MNGPAAAMPDMGTERSFTGLLLAAALFLAADMQILSAWNADFKTHSSGSRVAPASEWSRFHGSAYCLPSQASMQSQSIAPSVEGPTNVKPDGVSDISGLTGNLRALTTTVNPRQGIKGIPVRMRSGLAQPSADWARAGASLQSHHRS